MDYSILTMEWYLNIKTRATYNTMLVAQVSFASFECEVHSYKSDTWAKVHYNLT